VTINQALPGSSTQNRQCPFFNNRKAVVHVRPLGVDSVEKLPSSFGEKILEKKTAEILASRGRAVSDDLRPQLRTVRHPACFMRICGYFCSGLQDHARLGNKFFNRIGQYR
jgi:hypothetical protein